MADIGDGFDQFFCNISCYTTKWLGLNSRLLLHNSFLYAVSVTLPHSISPIFNLMRALIQRVLEAKVVVEGQTTGEIQHGLLVFLGLGKSDTLEQGQKLIDKILKYRIFDDEQGKMGWNLSQAQGGLLLVSQFTLMAQTQKGLRPDFGPAMPPAEAKALYEQLVEYARQQFAHVQTGIFAADMKVHLINDGPVTFNLEIE